MKHPPTESRRQLDSAEWLLAALAALTMAAARLETCPYFGLLVLQTGLSAVVPFAAAAIVRRRWGASEVERLQPLAVVVWAAAPAVLECLLRSVGIGEPTEIVMLVVVQNVALALAAFPRGDHTRSLPVLLSGSLVLFAIVIGERPPVYLFAAVFAVVLLWWLMARYWDRVQQAQPAASVESCWRARGGVLAGTIGAAVLIGLLVGRGGTTTYVLAGFLPTSGGDRWSDLFARAGVGDGEDLVAAKDQAHSFGPVESQLFLESQMPTLYDMFNDMYGDPPKPKKSAEKNIGLAPDEVRQNHSRLATSEKGGREFSAVRRRKLGRHQSPSDLPSNALLLIAGRVPLHLGLEAFDTFDGRTWTAAAPVSAKRPSPRLQREGERPWIVFAHGAALSLAGESDSHVIKFVNLKSNRVPAPPWLAAVHIDKVDRADFFGWTADGMIEMTEREQIPPLTVLQVRSQIANLTSLRERAAPVPNSAARVAQEVRPSPGGHSTAILAREWTRGVAPGWQQVEAIVARLRTDFSFDPEAVAPEESPDVVAHFLRSGRGPDYLFATAAAMLIRELGYQTRLVGGLYARAERFDRGASQTAVLREDAHVWIEVSLDGRTWIAVEPTPGFAPPRESLPWSQRLAAVWRQSLRWLGGHAGEIAAVVCLFALLWRTRIVWCDALLASVCRSLGVRRSRRIPWTLWLLEWRSRLAGKPRPTSVTVSAWYRPLAVELPPQAGAPLLQFLQAADRALYAPASAADNAESRVCAAVIRALPAYRLRQILTRREMNP